MSSALLDVGYDVVAASRNPDRLVDFGWRDQVTGVTLDAHDDASAKKAFADAGPIDVVYYLVHGIGQPDYRDADNRAAANVANAAKDTGVRRIVYLGGFGPDVVWLGAAMIIGPETTSYGELLRAYARISGKWRAELPVPVNGVDTSVVSWMTAAALPVPGGLAADLVESLDHPMMASEARLRDLVPDPPGGLLGIDQAISRALSSDRRRPVDDLDELRDIVSTVAVPHHEPPALIRRRRIVVTVVLVVGGALLGYSLTRRPGDESFYWLTLALAAVWALGAFASGPLHLGSVRFRGRNQRPVISGTVIGLALGGVFLVGGLVAREIPGVREFVTRVLDFANHGPLALVVFITVINGVAEELFFRGALYTALGKAYPAVVSTVIYVVATAATTGNPMLGVAALIVGAVCAWERRATGGVLAPMLTHFFWGLVMVLALPPVFGV